MNDSFDRQLRRHLFRFDCPESEVLAEYHSGSLENELREKIAAHLENCVRCREELEAFREFYQNEESGLRKGL